MPTIDTSYFFGPITIANITDAAVVSSFNLFLSEYEEKLLTDLLGYDLSKKYKAGIASPTPDAKWTDLRDGKEYTNRIGILQKWKGLKFTDGTAKKSLIANYVYYMYMRNNATVTTGVGEKIAKAQNAEAASSAYKMVNAWNQMVEWNWELSEFFLSNPASYPEFSDHYGRGFGVANSFMFGLGYQNHLRNLLSKQNTFGI